MKRVLVVEDEASIREMVALNLKMAGWEVVEAPSAERALELMHHGEECDAALLDIMLPGMDGLSLCETIRRENNEIGIIIVSAKGQESDKIRGLSIGADDYITKPFSPREVVYRVRAQLRRQQYQSASSRDTGLLAAGPLTLDRESGRAYKEGRELCLTGREFLLLACLMEHADRILSKEQLYEQVWGEYSSICDNTIMVHIRHLREKIEDTPSDPRQLVTVKGLGYKLKKRMG